MKNTYDNITLKSERLNSILLRLRTGPERPPSSLLFNIVLEVLGSAMRKEKEMRDLNIEKKERKSSLFTGNVVVYAENSKNVLLKY